MMTMCDEARTFNEGTLIRGIIGDRCRRLNHRLHQAKEGWKVWKEQVPEDLHVHGLDRERMYELMAEWFLKGSDLLSVMLSLTFPETHILVINEDDDVMFQFCANGICYQKIMFEEDCEEGLMITYHDLMTGRKNEWPLDVDELLVYNPSFT